MKKIGQIAFAAGFTGLGMLSLIYRDFALVWQPVPPEVPHREVLAIISGAILLFGGLALFVPVTARWAAAGLAAFVTSWLLLLQVPRVAASPADVGIWLGFGENMISVTGGWTLFALLSAPRPSPAVCSRIIRLSRLFYALLLPVIGLSHFVYPGPTASFVPAWLPFHLGFAYLTGAGHMAAGLGLLLGVVPRLAAIMEAAMLSCFVLLLHLPGVLHAPTDRLQWTMLCIATAYTGAAWAIAGAQSFVPARVLWPRETRPTAAASV